MPRLPLMRFAAAAFSLLVLLSGMWSIGRAGLSRYLVSHKKDEKLLPAVNGALWLTPSDPEVYYARAMIYWRLGDFAAAAKNYEQVTVLRPSDYVAWLDLGSARDKMGDLAGAAAAYRTAVRLAPFYADPYWELGEIQLLMGRREEAFVNLRRAVASEPVWLEDLIDAAIEQHGDDPAMILQAVRPTTGEHQWKLALEFLKRGHAPQALDLYRIAGRPSGRARHGFLTGLLNANHFREAYEVWSETQNASSTEAGDRRRGAIITDGGFEGRINFAELGFNWQSPGKLADVNISHEKKEPHSGAQSLHLHFHGKTQTGTPLIWQLVVLEPEQNYRLSFAARTQDIVAGALPELAVLGEEHSESLKQTIVLPSGTNAWSLYHLEFSTPKEVDAVNVILRRRSCTGAPCPIFGHLWLDSFFLEKL